MSRLFGASIFLGVGLTLALPASSQQISPPRTEREIIPSKLVVRGTTKPVKVVLLPSWGVTSGWEDLQTQWPKYGTTPLVIDDSTYIGGTFTYTDLVNSKANVIVLSDPAGGGRFYSADEIAAVQLYANNGHTVLGTYAVFEAGLGSNPVNRGLLPVFGLDSSLSYNYFPISNTFDQVASESCLLTNITPPWHSTGYPYSQAPSTGEVWTTGALDLATVVAQSDGLEGIVSIYNGGTYEGIFISNYPEYGGGTDDLQLLYNAVTCYSPK